MGIYVNTLRKAKTPIYVDGERVMAWNHQYAYKVSYSGESSIGDWGKTYRFTVGNAERRAQEAFEVYDGGYVVQTIDGKPGENFSVYRAMRDPIHYDTDDTPAEYVGKVNKVGRKWVLTPAG